MTRIPPTTVLTAALTAMLVTASGEVAFASDSASPSFTRVEADTTATSSASTPPTKDWAVRSIGADKVHERGITGAGVKVAIIDHGVASVVGLDDKVVARRSFSDQGFVWPWHGTEVAGVIAAGPHLPSGTGGIAPGVTLMSAEVSDATRDGDAKSAAIRGPGSAAPAKRPWPGRSSRVSSL